MELSEFCGVYQDRIECLRHDDGSWSVSLARDLSVIGLSKDRTGRGPTPEAALRDLHGKVFQFAVNRVQELREQARKLEADISRPRTEAGT